MSTQKLINYDMQTKQKALQLIGENFSLQNLKEISEQLSVPIKTIRRWCFGGIDGRKKSGRKKFDQYGEQQLVQWIIETAAENKKIVTRKDIQRKAKQLIDNSQFKASKGWIDKLFKNYQLRKKMNQVIEQSNDQEVYKMIYSDKVEEIFIEKYEFLFD